MRWPLGNTPRRTWHINWEHGISPSCHIAVVVLPRVAMLLSGDPELRQHCSFARVNIDRVKPLVRQLGISKIPTVLLLGPDGSTLDSFRASGQVARDALQQQLAAMQQQQQQLTLQPSLPSLPPGAAGLEEQPAPSEVDGNGNGSNEATDNGLTDNGPANGDSTSSTDGSSSSSSSSSSGAACGVVPDPSCGSLPPGIVPGDESASTSNSRPAGELPPAASTSAGAPATPPATTPNRPAAVNTSPEDEALQAAKQAFLQQYGSEYGYNGWLEQHYQQEIGYRLTADKHYLDYTGVLRKDCCTGLAGCSGWYKGCGRASCIDRPTAHPTLSRPYDRHTGVALG